MGTKRSLPLRWLPESKWMAGVIAAALLCPQAGGFLQAAAPASRAREHLIRASSSAATQSKDSPFAAPVLPRSLSASELLLYLGDSRTRRRAAQRLLKHPEALSRSGLVELVQATCRMGNRAAVLRILALMRECGPGPDVTLYEALHKLANARYMWDVVLSLFKEMEVDGIAPTPAMLGSALHSCMQTDRAWEAVNLLGRYRKHGLQPSLPSLMSLVRFLSGKGMLNALRRVTHEMESMAVEGDAALYGALVNAFGRAGSYDDVMKVAGSVEGRRTEDMGRVYSTAVASLLTGNRTVDAKVLYGKVMEQGLSVSKKACEVIVANAAQSDDPALSAFFLKEMKAGLPEGETFAAKTYWRPIGACVSAGLLELAADLLGDYYTTVDGAASDAIPLRQFVRACCTGAQPACRDLALEVYEDISRKVGFLGDSYTTMVVIGAYRAKEQWDRVIQIHEEAQKKKVDLWLPAAANVMQAYQKAGRHEDELATFVSLASLASQSSLDGDKQKGIWEKCLSRAMFLADELCRQDVADAVVKLLQRSPTISAGAKDYMNLIKALSAAGRPDDAKRVLLLMSKRKEKPSTLHYNAVVHAFAKAERFDDAQAVLTEMKAKQVPLDASTYNTLLSCLERMRQPDRALELFKEMSRAGHKPDQYTFSSLISVTADLENRTQAAQLLNTFRGLASQEQEPSPVMYGALMHALGRGDPASKREVLKLLDEAKAKGLKPNAIIYGEALYALSKLVREDPAASADRALSLYRELESSGVTADAQIYRRLFTCLKQACRFEDVAAISKGVPDDMITVSEKLAKPVIACCLRVGEQQRAVELLSTLVLERNVSYHTYRWATWAFCTKVNPPDVNAGEALIQIVSDRGWKPDHTFYDYLLRGFYRRNQTSELMETYYGLPKPFGGGDRGALAALMMIGRGKLDKVPGLLQQMRDYDDVAAADLMCEMVEKLLTGEHWKLALQTVELMIDLDVALTVAQRKALTSVIQSKPTGPALEVLEGLGMLSVVNAEEQEDDYPRR